MAVYRFCILRHQNLVIVKVGVSRFKNLILFVEGLIISLLVYLFWFELKEYGTSPSMEFCSGHSRDQNEGKNILLGIVLILQALTCIEISIYFAIFYGIYLQNRRQNLGLSKEVIGHRNKVASINHVHQRLGKVTWTSYIASLPIFFRGMGDLKFFACVVPG